MKDPETFKAFGHLTFFMTFHVVTMPKFGQIYNVKYLSFHLTPSLPTFMKIDITYENGNYIKAKKQIMYCAFLVLFVFFQPTFLEMIENKRKH